MLWHEVAYSDRPDTAVGEKRLERAVGVDREIKLAGQRLMKDEQVELVDADLALIEVSSGAIDEAVTRRQGALDGGFRLFIGDLEDTKAEARHYDAIVQGDRGVHGFDDKHEEKFVPTST